MGDSSSPATTLPQRRTAVSRRDDPHAKRRGRDVASRPRHLLAGHARLTAAGAIERRTVIVPPVSGRLAGGKVMSCGPPVGATPPARHMPRAGRPPSALGSTHGGRRAQICPRMSAVCEHGTSNLRKGTRSMLQRANPLLRAQIAVGRAAWVHRGAQQMAARVTWSCRADTARGSPKTPPARRAAGVRSRRRRAPISPGQAPRLPLFCRRAAHHTLDEGAPL
jgi:hypothetical protein